MRRPTRALDKQLFVIGDSHAHFWTGTGDRYGIDRIPGICTTGIPGALAYNLVEEVSTTNSRKIATHVLYTAVNEGFTGWVMLAFGTVDCETFVWRHAQTLGLHEAVRRIVDRYMTFIFQVRNFYPRVAVWGPIATKKALAHDSAVGNEVERNLAVLVFTEMLYRALEPHGIPLITMTEALIATDGRTRHDLYMTDESHISQKMMPYALSLVNDALDLHLTQGDAAIAYTEQLITEFAVVEQVHEFERIQLQFVLPEGAQFVTDIALAPQVFSELHKISITTTSDQGYEFEEICCDGSIYGAKERYILPVRRVARKILIWGEMRPLGRHEVEIYVRATQMHGTRGFDKTALLALCDQVCAHAQGHPSRELEPLGRPAGVM